MQIEAEFKCGGLSHPCELQGGCIYEDNDGDTFLFYRAKDNTPVAVYLLDGYVLVGETTVASMAPFSPKYGTFTYTCDPE